MLVYAVNDSHGAAEDIADVVKDINDGMYSLNVDDVDADVGVPVPPDSDKSKRFQDLVNVIFETPNPLEELEDVAGVSLIFALFFISLEYINMFSYISCSFCLCLMLCALFILSLQC